MPRHGASLREIARVAGVSVATVSMALKDNPLVAQKTRARVAAVAKRLGYRPDPRIASAMSLVRTADASAYKGTLALLMSHGEEDAHDWIWAKRMWAGASERAERLGYKIESFRVEGGHVSAKRLSGVLHARGIKGVLITPLRAASSVFPLDFEKFAAVAVGHSLSRSPLHRVTRSLFFPLLELFDRLVERGYRRVGFCIEREENRRMMQVVEAVALVHHAEREGETLVPPLIYTADQGGDAPLRPKMLDWVRTHRPDVVIGPYSTLEILRELAWEAPRDYGFVALHRAADDFDRAGFDPRYEQLASSAVDMLVQEVESGRIGPPADPRLILVEGAWNWGKTLSAPRSS